MRAFSSALEDFSVTYQISATLDEIASPQRVGLAILSSWPVNFNH